MKLFKSVTLLMATFSLCSLLMSEDALAGSGGGGHGNLSEKMNSLFPKKEAEMQKREVPAKPELISPEFSSKVSSDKTTLQWKAVEGAEEYHVQVATDPNFKWLVANDYHVKNTSYEIIGLEANKDYFWRVAAFKGSNWSTFRKSYFASSTFNTSK